MNTREINGRFYARCKIFPKVCPSFLLVIACLLTGPRLAAQTLHGPIAQWHNDPARTVTFLWIERQEKKEDVQMLEHSAAEWKIGKAPFGYGEDRVQTRLDMKNKGTRLYFRKELKVPSAIPKDARLELHIDYDDGFIFTMDGVEKARASIASGSGANATGIKSHESGKPEVFNVGVASELLTGPTTLLAVELHNVNLGSSDMVMDAALLLVTPGQEPHTLMPMGDAWQFWAGGDPEENWQRMQEPRVEAPVIAPPTAEAPAPVTAKRTETTVTLRSKKEEKEGLTISARLAKRPFGKTGNWVHVADVEGLTPGTNYMVSFAGGLFGDFGKTFAFQTAPETLETPLKFVTGGDMYHTRPLLDAMNSRCAKQDPLFALLGGDLAYANGRDDRRWYDWMDSWATLAVTQDRRMIPMVVTIGNHEASSQGKPEHAPFYYSLFTMPTPQQTNYAIDFGDYMSIVLLDSGHSQPVNSQTSWLQTTLEAKSRFPHLFTCYHRPAFGAGVKANDKNIVEAWVPLFERYQIDAAFENDHHVYKRTKRLTEGKEDQEKGILYIGDGAWGVRVRPIPKDKGIHLEYMERAESLNHLIEVELDGTHIHYRAMTADGNVFDKVSYPRRRAVR